MGRNLVARGRLQRLPADLEPILAYAQYSGKAGYDHIGEEIPNELAVNAADEGTRQLRSLFSDENPGWW